MYVLVDHFPQKKKFEKNIQESGQRAHATFEDTRVVRIRRAPIADSTKVTAALS